MSRSSGRQLRTPSQITPEEVIERLRQEVRPAVRAARRIHSRELRHLAIRCRLVFRMDEILHISPATRGKIDREQEAAT